jgi:exonuclease VII small subunit
MEKGQKKLDEVFQEFEKATQSPKEGKSGAQELGKTFLSSGAES